MKSKKVVKAEQVDKVVDLYFAIFRGTKPLTKEEIENIKKEIVEKLEDGP